MTATTNGTTESRTATGAEALLRSLRRNGVRYMFSNSGTDFPPIIEAIARLDPDERPEHVLVPHETAAMGMAHGYHLVTGETQAVMVHVNVGLANCTMGVINAASDNVPVLVMSGRTPITERGRPGGRLTPIQYGQEMYDQSSLVADVVKYHYEMRYPEQGESLPTRALAIANSAPAGPVYLSLPREPLMEPVPPGLDAPSPQQPATRTAPDPQAIATLAEWVAQARAPLIVAQRGDAQGRTGQALAAIAERHGLAVVEPFPVRNLLPGEHPMLQGHDPAAIAEADLVIALDSDVPWIEALHRPDAATTLVHIGPDPLFQRMPVRGYRADLSIAADPAVALEALALALPAPDDETAQRVEALAAKASARRAAIDTLAAEGADSPMSGEWLSRCLSEIMDEKAVLFSEIGVVAAALRPKGPNRVFSNVHAGGLGWGFPAALGAQLADRDRLTIACIGDGSYMFANPVACHQIAEALELPVLVVVKNNGIWNAVRRAVLGSYPDGAASRANEMPLTSLQPAPDYTMIARASRAHAERVTNGAELPAALERALAVIRQERRAALLDVAVALSDRH